MLVAALASLECQHCRAPACRAPGFRAPAACRAPPTPGNLAPGAVMVRLARSCTSNGNDQPCTNGIGESHASGKLCGTTEWERANIGG